MKRLALAICVSLSFVASRPCKAEEPYRAWLNFFEGKWDVNQGEWSFEFRFTKGRSIIYGEISPPGGDDALAVYAWDAAKKALVFSWFDAKGGYIRQEFTVFKGDVMTGLLYGSGAGYPTTGSVTVQRLGPDKFKGILKITDASGETTEPFFEATRRK